MKKPFDNKTYIDPGEFRHKIQFYKEQNIPDGYGGSTVGWVFQLETRAKKSKISEGNQMAIAAGANVFDQSCYFTIRKRSSFIPEKDIRVLVESERYTIKGFAPVDDPIRYYRLLCIKSDWEGNLYDTYGNFINAMPAPEDKPYIIDTTNES